MKKIKHIKFKNKRKPNFQFDMVKMEDLLMREFNHDITQFHKIEFYHILIITEGQGYHTIDFTEYKYKRGTILTIRKDQIHKFFRNTGVKGYLLLFTEDFIASHFSKLEALKSIQLFNELLSQPKIELSNNDYTDVITLVKQIESEYNEFNDEFSIGITRSALHMLIIKLFRIKAKSKNILIKKKYLTEFLQFQKLVEQHCFETKKVIDYASKMNCTTKTVNNVVNNILNKPAKAVIDEMVITQIKRLLINSPLSIKEVAYTAGFDDPTNLYKYFKKHTNTSPEVFRKAH